MIITCSNDTLMLIGVLSLILLPQLHLILIFAIYYIFEEFGKFIQKIIKFTFDIIFPLMALYLLCMIFLKMITIIYNDFRNDYNSMKL